MTRPGRLTTARSTHSQQEEYRKLPGLANLTGITIKVHVNADAYFGAHQIVMNSTASAAFTRTFESG